MMKRIALGLALLLAAQPVLAQKPAPMQDRMVGIWFGSGQPGDRSQMYIDTFNADGTFHALHRACMQGKALDQTQTGRWRLSGNVLTISMTAVNGQATAYEDRYRVNAVDGITQDYTLLANNFGYRARKVDGKFQMPPCDLSS